MKLKTLSKYSDNSEILPPVGGSRILLAGEISTYCLLFFMKDRVDRVYFAKYYIFLPRTNG